MTKIISDLDQPKQKQSTVLRNKMAEVAYQLFNSFRFNREFELSFTKILYQIPLRSRINKPEFDKLTSDIYNNQGNKDLKITINKETYDLKKAKHFWAKVSTSKISRNEAKNCIINGYKKTLMH